MIQGRNLQGLITELKRQDETKRDFMAVTGALLMANHPSDEMPFIPLMNVGNEGAFELNEIAHRQVGQYLKIPAPYYERMRAEAPDLLVDSINTWLNQKDERRFVRVLDGRIRAFLSNSYRVMDNLVVVGNALEALAAFSGIQVKSCEVTERRVYLAATTPDLEAKVAGDVIHGGLRVTNSEVGLGALLVETFIMVLKCGNGARGMDTFRRRHLGRRIEGEEEAYEFFADDTILADRRALGLKVRDTIRAALSQDKFMETVKLLEGTAARELPAESVKPVIQEVTKRYALTEKDGDGILAHLLNGGNLSQWNLANAVTELANKDKSYDRAYELEGIGGQILALDDAGWGALVKKAA
jgi:hypothetical protein